jgi:RimJ/RimL family protein N-acetyltransferase
MTPRKLFHDTNMMPRKLYYESDKTKLINHFLDDISNDDRYLRFGYPASDNNVMDYIEKSLKNFSDTDMWFVVEKDNYFIGTVHVSLNKSSNSYAELGFTVSPNHRNQGIGQYLFDRAATWAVMKGYNNLYTQCLSENKVMQHIAKKNGMTVVTIGQGEKEATLSASKSKAEAFYIDSLFDGLTFVDMAIQKQQHFFKKFLLL